MTRSERIQYWREHIQGHVEGWVHPDMPSAIEVCGQVLDEDNTAGSVAEFGVHHGLFLFLIDALRTDGEDAVAIGIWDDPTLKVVTPGPGWDEMQHGAFAAFQRNSSHFLGGRRVQVVTKDTFGFTAAEFMITVPRPVKFFSVDAGHTPENVVNDLSLVQDILAPGGIVALDDYLNPYWEGVTDGFYRFMASHNRRLRPFLFFRNKLFLTTISEHRDHVRRFAERMAEWCDLRSVAGCDCVVEKPR